MDLISVLFIAFSLSADCFAVALSGSASMGRLSRFQVGRVSFAFGLSQFLMSVLGWLAGRTIVSMISAYDHWVGFILLTLSVATSIDSLAVGLSFAFLEIGIIQASLIIGLVAFSVTALGFWLGRKAGVLLGKRAKLVGGVILIGIGLRILLTHVM